MKKEIIGNATLYCGDSLEILPTLCRVNAVVTDPPYGVNLKRSTTKSSSKSKEYDLFDDTPDEIKRICVPIISLCMSMADCGIMTPGGLCAYLYDPPVVQGAIFYPGGANSGPWGFFMSQPLFYYGKDPYLQRGLGRQPNGFSSFEPAVENGHPCPKPVKQTEWMVNRVSFPNELIIDPFMGSGTTGVACFNLTRKFIGIELSPTYFEIACRRIEEANKNQVLF
jgi:DNA modification methylase